MPKSPAIHDLRPGDAIGPYELLYPAARGGFATVWAARRRGSRGFGQIVALKLLSVSLRGDPDAEAMFMDEARTAAAIVHPNVGQVLDFSEDRGLLYLAMEWIDGESLASIFAARRASKIPLPVAWVLHVAAAACAGLHAAHELRDEDGQLLNVVHRDVSPQNVMVTWNGFVKVVDFGIAKSRRRAHVTRVLGTIKGKVGYFSPEQIAGRDIDRRSDLFSLGILLYLLLTNVHPFRKTNDADTIASIALGERASPRALVPELPREVEAVLDRALAQDPADRYQSAAELQRALEHVIVATGAALASEPVGQVVKDLFPGVEEERSAQLAHAIQLADAARASIAPLDDGPRGASPAPEPARVHDPDAATLETDATPGPLPMHGTWKAGAAGVALALAGVLAGLALRETAPAPPAPPPRPGRGGGR